MNDPLDQQIARVTFELNKLRQQKLEFLRRQMRELEETGGEVPPVPVRVRRSFTDAEVKEALSKAVEEAGENGISALKAAEETGVSYARVRPLMPKLFKKTGSGRGTLYVLRKKRGG